ncbi:MAG: helicase-exonuclease AddAB subunit AddB, partial [Lachnospiraceae bacterium]|nr:helicase-exonuclease AddAB subunit AddB [Lachnospiraceae bacterium]
MGLKFYFGGSGAGKSMRVYQDMIAWSLREPERRFFIIVPDQFTMQTQKDFVLLHPDRGIMNIDVLSFGRLTHRILEEVGGEDIPVLDDTGKNLILRKVAAAEKDRLKVLGGSLNRTGYIHEVKSVISEFMQYGIRPEQVGEMAQAAKGRGLLPAKLGDMRILYEAFLSYIHERFITTEESLDLLCRALPRSALIKRSVIVFDGFTGFTPVQNRVLQELMTLCKQVCVTILIDEAEDPFRIGAEQKLFYLSQKTTVSLCKLQEQAGIAHEEDVFLKGVPVIRHQDNPFFSYLEQNLFRYGRGTYEGESASCQIY